MFTSYNEEKVMTSDGNIYLLQYGSFIDKEVMKKNIEKLDNYLLYESENKYYVHLGVFTKLDIATRMQKIFEKENIYTYIKNDYLGDSNLIKEIAKLENGILETNEEKKIKELNKEIINLVKKVVS